MGEKSTLSLSKTPFEKLGFNAGKEKHRMIVTEYGKSLVDDSASLGSLVHREVLLVQQGSPIDVDGTQTRIAFNSRKKPKVIVLPTFKKDGSNFSEVKLLVDKQESVGLANKAAFMRGANGEDLFSRPRTMKIQAAQIRQKEYHSADKVGNPSTSISQLPSLESPNHLKPHNSQIVIPIGSSMRNKSEPTSKHFIPEATRFINLKTVSDDFSDANMFRESSAEDSVPFLGEPTPHKSSLGSPHGDTQKLKSHRIAKGTPSPRHESPDMAHVKVLKELEEIGKQNLQYKTLQRLLKKRLNKQEHFNQAVDPSQSYKGFFKFVSTQAAESPFQSWQLKNDELLSKKYSALQVVKLGDFPIECLNMDKEFLQTSISKAFQEEVRLKNKCVDLIKKTEIRCADMESRLCSNGRIESHQETEG